MPKASKKPAESQDKAKTISDRATALLASVGGDDGVVVAVFRRIPGKAERAHIATYNEDEFSPDRVLEDHGAGYFTMQVKADNKLVKTKNFTVGDVGDLTPVAITGKESREPKPESDGSMMMKLLLAQQSSMTQIVVAMIGAGGNRPDSSKDIIGLFAPMLAASMKDKGSVLESVKGLQAMQELAASMSGGDEDRGSSGGGGSDVVGLLTAIINQVPAALEKLGVGAGGPKHVANTATDPKAAKTEIHQPRDVSGGDAKAALPDVAASGAASPPGPEVASPAPSVQRKRLPFPGAQDIADAIITGIYPLLPGDDDIPAEVLNGQMDAACDRFAGSIEDAGGDVDFTLDCWPDVAGMATALVEYEPKLARARKLLAAIDEAIRVKRMWAPPIDDDDDEPKTKT